MFRWNMANTLPLKTERYGLRIRAAKALCSIITMLLFFAANLFLCVFVLSCVCEYEWCESIMYPVVIGSVVKVTSRTKGRNVLINDA